MKQAKTLQNLSLQPQDHVEEKQAATAHRISDQKTEIQQEKVAKIAKHFSAILETLGMDLDSPNLRNTPQRVAKMYMYELFASKDDSIASKPQLTLFPNDFSYNQMLVEKDIRFYSLCEHHLLPIIGNVHIAYKPNQKIIGLSKLNRLVHYYAAQPQVQERFNIQIFDDLLAVLDTPDIMVWVEAEHLCVSMRGIRDRHSQTITTRYSGAFNEEITRNEFLSIIRQSSVVV